jgi:phosphatidylserine/phosphatidylglycerophosphate/cardiolipin synthase-like enzyme
MRNALRDVPPGPAVASARARHPEARQLRSNCAASSIGESIVTRPCGRPFSLPSRAGAVLTVCLACAAGAPGAAGAQQSPPPQLAGHASSRATLPVYAPEAWVGVALESCRAAAARVHAADDTLRAKLASAPASSEQASFLAREAAARERAAADGRRAALKRLNAMLFGGDARFPSRIPERSDSFLDVLEAMLGEGNSCGLEALEATALFAVFGVPFDADAAGHIRPDREFLVIETHIDAHVDAGDSLAQIFAHLRPRSAEDASAYIEAIVRGIVAMNSGSDAAIDPDVERRLRQFLEFITYAAEPLRIQGYLHARVDEVEGAFGLALTDAADAALFGKVEDTLYSSVDRMRRLRGMPPEAVLAAVDPIVDRWFGSTAVAAFRRALERRPFAGYWFFVRTGATPIPGSVFADSRVAVRNPSFVVSQLASLPLADALARIRDARVPAAFVEHHAALETAFTNLTLSGDELQARIDRRNTPAPQAAALRQFLLNGNGLSRASSLDIYARLIGDASRIRGRIDQDVMRAAIDVVSAAKSDRLNEEIARMLGAAPAPDPRLAEYLRTSAALMVELEQRQASDSAFRQGTAGAAIGWLLSNFFIGGSVPIALWAPGGVSGPEFAELVDEVAPKNARSGNDYHGKPADDIDLVHDGREYHGALVSIIDSAEHFLNISSFDWKTDAGGRDIAYRLMAKKLGIDGADYAEFLAAFERGLPMDPASRDVIAFYDLPTTRMKDLLVTFFVRTSRHPDVVGARNALKEAGATLECRTVMTCGDLSALLEQTGSRYDRRRRSAEYDRAWQAYRQIEALFADRTPSLEKVRPRRALRDYCEDAAALRRFVRRVGLRRADRPDEPFPINIVTDAKQNLFNIKWGERSQVFPYVITEPIRDIHFMLLEFDARVVLWKGAAEFPWHIGPVPIMGRKLWGVIPMPFVPYPWLNAVPGFQWLGPCTTLLLQYLLASDIRIWWGSVSHTKSWSTETMALESGMGMGSKYFNQYDEHRTWHDMGVLVRGAPVDDVNDHFVEVFNEARVNNVGLPSARGATIPRLRYEDYRRAVVAADDAAVRDTKTWVVTTHPEQGDSNYRGIYVAALAAARRNIYIENSFFSDPLLARMLVHKAREFRGRVNCEGLASHDCAARLRDAVQIYIVLPDTSDKPIVDAVGAADFHQMLHLGIKVHRWRPEAGWSASTMLHSKVWLIDYEPGRSGLAYVGAANATQRSHLADNEAGILSNDPAFADQVYARVFGPDLTSDSRVESGEGFHVVWSSNAMVRASRWLRRLLVELFWFI